MTNQPERNRRYSRSFTVSIIFGNSLPEISATAIRPSCRGASLSLSPTVYQKLAAEPNCWEKKRISVRTVLRELPAEINALFSNEEGYFASLKLLDNHTWYN